MSQEKVDVYFAAKDRLAVGDHDGFARLLHPDVIATVTNLPEPGPFVGRDAVVAQLEAIGIEFDGQRYSDVEIVADRNGWIVLTYRWSVRGTRSGVDVDANIAVAFRVKDALLLEVHWRETRDAALEAAGLRESPMPQENVEVVRRAIDAYNRGQEALDLFDPEIVWVTTGRFVEPGTYRGHEEVRRYLKALRDDFEELHVEPHELAPAGDDVIVPVRFTGRGRLSSAPIDLEFTFVFSLRDGKVVRVRNYWEQADALAAVDVMKKGPPR